MTNKELMNRFEEINLSQEIIFDKYNMLENIKEDYKTTPFYKLTKKNIYEAFELYLITEGKIASMLNVLNNEVSMEHFLNKIIEVFDVNRLLEKTPKEDKELMKELLTMIQ